ncbi:MAG: hydrolase [Clostridiales bacterium]|nr:hydrolase [Clostridiales bacterium]
MVKRITKENAVLVVVDLQERLFPAMAEREVVEPKCAKLIEGARLFKLPIIVTEQYPKGLGPTTPDIMAALGDQENCTIIPKAAYSVMEDPAVVEAMEATGRKTVLLCGIEGHVCVQQTALDLLARGYDVFLVQDCISSRSLTDLTYARARMQEAGVLSTTMEAALFELCVTSKAPEFKALSALVK